MVTDFQYNDIVLYAKHWYKHSDNIIDDLGYLFSKIYGWKPKSEQDVARMMMTAIDRLYEEMDIQFDTENNGRWKNSFSSFHTEIRYRMRLYDVSFDMAVISWALHIFFCLDKNEIKLNPPHYGKKEHFRMGCLLGKDPISMTYTEMNRIAQKYFS